MPDVLQNPRQLLGVVDELKQRVSQLELALEHQERLATLGTLVGLISHEFNNILTPVMSYAQMALGNPQDHDLVLKALQRAIDGTERAAAISTAILGFVRDDSSDLHPSPRMPNDVPHGTDAPQTFRTSLRATVDDALSCLARDPKKDGITVELEIPPHLTAGVRPLLLQHVLLNVLLNARSAMLPGGGRLTITGCSHSSLPPVPTGAVTSSPDPAGLPSQGVGGDPSWVSIEVRDTGRGMDAEQLANLFRPFYTRAGSWNGGDDRRQVPGVPHGTRGGVLPKWPERPDGLPERRGTGLGMTICKRLLAECGGVMHVTSRPGAGTTVSIVLPAASAADRGHDSGHRRHAA